MALPAIEARLPDSSVTHMQWGTVPREVNLNSYFVHSEGRPLTYEVSLLNGQTVLAWHHPVAGQTDVIVVTSKGVGTSDLLLVARDDRGLTQQQKWQFVVSDSLHIEVRTRAPVVAELGGPYQDVVLDDYFSHPTGEPLQYTVAGPSGVFTYLQPYAWDRNQQVYLLAGRVGTGDFIVTAKDALGRRAEARIPVTVPDPCSFDPTGLTDYFPLAEGKQWIYAYELGASHGFPYYGTDTLTVEQVNPFGAVDHCKTEYVVTHRYARWAEDADTTYDATSVTWVAYGPHLVLEAPTAMRVQRYHDTQDETVEVRWSVPDGDQINGTWQIATLARQAAPRTFKDVSSACNGKCGTSAKWTFVQEN